MTPRTIYHDEFDDLEDVMSYDDIVALLEEEVENSYKEEEYKPLNFNDENSRF